MIRIIKIETKEDSYALQERVKKGVWKDLAHFTNKEEAIKEYLSRINPIKDNRIVSDTTFAVRFKNFLDEIQPCDPCSEEELDYLKMVADRLLDYQKLTVESASYEEKYLKDIKIL